MNIFNPVNYVFFLTDKSLLVYSNKGELLGKINFNSQFIDNQEILDTEHFQTLIEKFISKINVKNKPVILILSDSITYHKVVTPISEESKIQLEEKFLSDIPFTPEMIAKSSFPFKNKVLLIATNKSLYRTVKDNIESANGKVVSVIPSLLTDLKELSTGLRSDDIADLMKNKNIFNTGDVFAIYDRIDQEKSTDPKNQTASAKSFMEQKKTLFIYFFALAILAGALAAITISFGLLKNPFNKSSNQSLNKNQISIQNKPVDNNQKQSTMAATPSSSPSATPKPTLPQISKQNITIDILNGSGISGQAGKLKDKLTALNYSQISVGNASSENNKTTTVTFSNTMTDTIQSEITNLLQQNFSKVDVKTSSDPNAQYDIVIVTGSNK